MENKKVTNFNSNYQNPFAAIFEITRNQQKLLDIQYEMIEKNLKRIKQLNGKCFRNAAFILIAQLEIMFIYNSFNNRIKKLEEQKDINKEVEPEK